MSESGSGAAERAGDRRESGSRKRRTVVGTVRTSGMQKTITVDVMRLERHRKYQKYIRRRTTYYAHDEREEARVGDLVRIEETRPLSRLKRWRLREIMTPSKSTGGGIGASLDVSGDEPSEGDVPGGGES